MNTGNKQKHGKSPVVEFGKLHPSKKNVVNTHQVPFQWERIDGFKCSIPSNSETHQRQHGRKFHNEVWRGSTTILRSLQELTSISGCTFQIFHGNTKFVQTEKNVDLLLKVTTMIDCRPFFSQEVSFSYLVNVTFSNSVDFLFCDFFPFLSRKMHDLLEYKINHINV